MTALSCDSCTETPESIGMAMGHVQDNPGHIVTGPADVEGATVTISAVDESEDDFDDFDDWDASDQQ